jgi:hypothetical protein
MSGIQQEVDADMLEEATEAFLLGQKCPGVCEHCRDMSDHLYSTPSQTYYGYSGIGPDPNADKLLCHHCSIEYRIMMTEKWMEYYSSVYSVIW